jgi:hypothetical protein
MLEAKPIQTRELGSLGECHSLALEEQHSQLQPQLCL